MTRPTVMITGASAGVGRATANEFARHGYRVGLLARRRAALEAAKAEVEAAGGAGLVLVADVADADQVQAAAERMESEWGGIDVWVNCAMVTVFSPVHEMRADEYRRVMDVTYLGYVHGTMAALRSMRRRNRGTIVQIGSALAFRGIPYQSAYCAAKFAIRGFTESLQTELIEQRSAIKLTTVHLPAVNTPQFEWARNRLEKQPQPVPPIFEPEAIAAEVYDAALSAPREVWVGRSTVQAIVGNMLAPTLLDRLMARKATKGQKSQRPALPDRPDNLYEPVPGDFGAQGRFGARASERVHAFNPSDIRWAAGALAALAFIWATAAAASGGRSRSRRRASSAEWSAE